MKELSSKTKNYFFVWAACLSLFILFVFLGQIKGSVPEKISDIAGFFVLIAILIGVATFIIFFFTSLSYLLKRKWFKRWDSLNKILKLFLLIIVFPLVLIFDSFNPIQIIKDIRKKRFKIILDKLFLKNFSFVVLIVLLLLPIWGSLYFVSLYIPANMTGLVSQSIPIVGDSMYPTLSKGSSTADMKPYPNGIKLSNINLFGYEISRRDIVVAENEKIRESTKKLHGESSGIVKRVIALPGDKLLIKDGLVYLNGKILKEPYIASPRSTFGGEFLKECSDIKIPEGKLFVMGDNRKGSGDSRHDTGFIDYKDIYYVLPFKDQLGKLDKGWHDPKEDDKESARTILDKTKYLELLNKKRKEEKLKPLTYQPKLERSSLLRGEAILKYDDFSYDATRSGYTQARAMNDAGYSNIVWNEGIVQGNYDAEELIEYLFEFPDWKENLLQVKDYQEVGIAEVRGEVNGCPTEVIVQHLAGYVPPNYSQEDIQGWGKVISSLNDVIPGWEEVRSYKGINLDDLNKLIALMYQRKRQAEAVYYRMKNNQWLTNQENNYVDQDKSLYDQIEALAKKLNSQ